MKYLTCLLLLAVVSCSTRKNETPNRPMNGDHTDVQQEAPDTTDTSLEGDKKQSPAPSGAKTTLSLVDANTTLATSEDKDYKYSKSWEEDFDHDSTMEKLTVIVNVEMDDDVPMWEDGHTWQVYVKEGANTKHLYAKMIPMGKLSIHYDPKSGLIYLKEESPSFSGMWKLDPSKNWAASPSSTLPENVKTIDLAGQEDTSN